jgi:hypothetical protein
MNYSKFLFLSLALSALCSSSVFAQSEASDSDLLSASPQELAVGVGHFERAHSLLAAAVREFDLGYKKVNTDKVLEASKWRGSLLERAKELEVVLSPKAREIKVGSRYSPDTRLLKTK